MRTTAVVVGAGPSGLAMSWWLGRRSVEHVVLERGRVAESWRTQRWDSLRLLTPNWQSRLPGFVDSGDVDPDGFRTLPQTIDFFERYARSFAPPLRTGCPVTAVRRHDDGYAVETPEGTWHCRAVVLASGAFNRAVRPALAAALPSRLVQVDALDYRRPDQLPEGGVLVVGAAASGVQIAEELQRAGRPVTIAVGEHVRAIRTYRGRDLQWWLDATGLHDERHDEVENLRRARALPSFQLAGHADRRNVDLNALRALGVAPVGRLVGVRDGRLQFSGSLRNVCALADLKLNRLLGLIDTRAAERGLAGPFEPPHRPAPTVVDDRPPLALDLARSNIRSVVWATGLRPDYAWLQIPVLDEKGQIRHDGGVVSEAPGLYVMGLPFLRRRKSSLIDGVGDDARELSAHLAAWLGGSTTAGATARFA